MRQFKTGSVSLFPEKNEENEKNRIFCLTRFRYLLTWQL